ncbi:MAG TPA: mechanosensitive ion channel family protein [Steroidobacteraceae bacterium]|nr:mechanosensitive ion channel family protein [Steroidobacteraceae bacterium]
MVRVCLAVVVPAGAAEPSAPASAVTDAPSSAQADLTVANRYIVTFRAKNEFGATPAMRAAGTRELLDTVIARGGPMEVGTVETPQGTVVVLDAHPVLRVLNGDVNPEAGETTLNVASRAAANLTLALRDLQQSRDPNYVLTALGKAALASVVLGTLLWLLTRGYAALAVRIRGYVQRRSASMVPEWGQQVVGGGGFGDLAVVPLKLLAWAIALLLLYQWAALVLEFFPYTRPWGEALLTNLVDALAGFGAGILRALPGVAFVVLIFAIARFIARSLRAFFDGVAAGRIHVNWFDETTARPTGRLLSVVVWLFALVAAYPYIPGSESEAFKGIGVFIGLMMSIGASGIVNQAVSGLMLMYTRTLRPGEFVQIGDTEGTVTSVGFVTTRIETLRNVEVNVPNAVITGNVTRNYSRLAGNGGMRLPTSVTIGYDTPWRQVHAMLLIAADRTASVERDPPPRVLQTALQDFYVEYTLVVSVAEPRRKVLVLDELHANIQDVFNEHGVQIMSPNYEADPADKKVVPKDQWFAAPAQK